MKNKAIMMNLKNTAKVPALKDIRKLVSKYKELQELEWSMAEKLDLNGEKINADTMNKVIVFAKRTAWGKVLDPILKDTHYLARLKKPTSDEVAALEIGKNRKKTIFDLFKMLPDLGYTHKKWEETPEENKSQPLGRPAVFDEVLYMRALEGFEEAKIEFNEIAASLSQKDKKTLASIIGHDVTAENLIRYGQHLLEVKAGGRKAAGGEIGKIERRISKLNEEIEYYESDQAKKDIQEELARRKANKGVIHGRPPMPVKEKLESLYSRRLQLMEEIANIEKSLPPEELLERRIGVARKKLKEIMSEMEDEMIDIDDDPKHPLSVKAKEQEKVLEMLQSYRGSPELMTNKEVAPVSVYAENLKGDTSSAKSLSAPKDRDASYSPRHKASKLMQYIAKNQSVPKTATEWSNLAEMRIECEVPNITFRKEEEILKSIDDVIAKKAKLVSIESFEDSAKPGKKPSLEEIRTKQKAMARLKKMAMKLKAQREISSINNFSELEAIGK